jgi:hypothetical protein
MPIINWDGFRIVDLSEIKHFLFKLIEVIRERDNLVKTMGSNSQLRVDLTSYEFSLTIADFKETIRIGRALESIYHQWDKDLMEELKDGF